MKKKIIEFVNEAIWLIKAYIYQPIIYKKTLDWVIDNDCSYSGTSKNNKWDYYWYGDFNTGYQVKVKKEI